MGDARRRLRRQDHAPRRRARRRRRSAAHPLGGSSVVRLCALPAAAAQPARGARSHGCAAQAAAGDAAALGGAGTKVFINVATSEHCKGMSKKTQLDAEGKEQEGINIPLSVGAPRRGTDKKGRACVVVDVVVNPEVVRDCQEDKSGSFRHFVCELALQYIEQKVRAFAGLRALPPLTVLAAVRHARVAQVQTAEDDLQAHARGTLRAAWHCKHVSRSTRLQQTVDGEPVREKQRMRKQQAPTIEEVDGAGAAGATARGSRSKSKKGGVALPGSSGAPQAPAIEERVEFCKAELRWVRRDAAPGELLGDGSELWPGGDGLVATGEGEALLSLVDCWVVRLRLPKLRSAAGVDVEVGSQLVVVKAPGYHTLGAHCRAARSACLRFSHCLILLVAELMLPGAVLRGDERVSATFDAATHRLDISVPAGPSFDPNAPAGPVSSQEAWHDSSVCGSQLACVLRLRTRAASRGCSRGRCTATATTTTGRCGR